MTIAEIPEREERDRFLRIVFDWNWRAAISALIETQSATGKSPSSWPPRSWRWPRKNVSTVSSGLARRVEGLLKEVPGPIRPADARAQVGSVLKVPQKEEVMVSGWERETMKQPTGYRTIVSNHDPKEEYQDDR